MSLFKCLVLIGLTLAAVASRVLGAEGRVFAVRGVIVAPLEDGLITVKHEAVAGYMPAMTMPFNVAPAARPAAAGLKVGDVVEFQFHVSGQESSADDFKVLRTGPAQPEAANVPTPGPVQRHLREGDRVPEFSLVDQEGLPLTAEELKGRNTVVTFIFTRCPVPDFCPRMSTQFGALQRRTANDRNVQLLSITLDPEFDTPAVLKAYGERYGADFSRWKFATGTAKQIADLRREFAVHAEKSASILDHTLATILIGPDLKIRAVWRGNQWKVDDVLQRLGRDADHGTP